MSRPRKGWKWSPDRCVTSAPVGTRWQQCQHSGRVKGFGGAGRPEGVVVFPSLGS